MNLSVKIAVASVLDKTGIISLVQNYRSTRGGLILSLHRVLPAAEAAASFEPEITITDTVFEQFLMLLHREFHVVSLTQLLNQPGDIGGQQRVALTFDDGWADTYTNAYPLLLRYGMPATVFLCPALMAEGQMLPEERFVRIWRWCVNHQHLPLLLQDLRKWGLAGGESQVRQTWSRLLRRLAINAKLLMLSHLEKAYGVPGCDKRRFLTWDEVRIMRRSNFSFGSHTLNHCTLTAEQQPTVDEELRNSREMIESNLHEEVRYLAYPNGAYDARVMEAARQAGYSYCFATQQGSFRRNANSLAIPRINIGNSVVVNRVSSLHASRVRFHLQHFVGPALLLAALTLRHAWCFQ
jgi:peptidoglycan/xylan/chitin deacetylase (PgdA/CDA1 family)